MALGLEQDFLLGSRSIQALSVFVANLEKSKLVKTLYERESCQRQCFSGVLKVRVSFFLGVSCLRCRAMLAHLSGHDVLLAWSNAVSGIHIR